MPSTSSKKESALTAERLRELLDYDPVTGIFRWRVSLRRGLAGAIAGTVRRDGYRKITILRTQHYSHRLAWLYVYGGWPADEIDHKDNTPGHDWIDNLRPATRPQQSANSVLHADNQTGLKGVSYEPRTGKWQARIRINGVQRHIGYFATAEAAHAAYAAGAHASFGDFANDGD